MATEESSQPATPAVPVPKPWPRRVGNRLFWLILRFTRRTLVKLQYYYVNSLDRHDKQIVLMNYGYVPQDPAEPRVTSDDVADKDRCALQLYQLVAGAVDLTGKDVLEVGCGRGGGAAYVARHLHPRRLVGIDLCASSADFCNEHYAIEGLTFRQGDAEALDFPDETFDAVINVESSHCYNYMTRFLAGVRRVLRPGGYFLFADFRVGESVKQLDDLLRGSGMEIVDSETINAGVFAALEQESDRKRTMIMEKVPRNRQAQFLIFAAVEGTDIYEGVRTGSVVYKRYVLRKPQAS